jgi:hypothetical protein
VAVLQQSVLSTQYVRTLISVQAPSPYDPTGDTVQFAFTASTYPMTSPAEEDWNAGSWVTFPGPAYWAQCLVGPANSAVSLVLGTYQVWVMITDDPEVPVLAPFLLQITP